MLLYISNIFNFIQDLCIIHLIYPGNIAIPVFESQQDATQTAALSLVLQNVSGQACLNITYMSYGPNTLQLIVRLHSKETEWNTTVMNVTAGDNVKDQVISSISFFQ